jgi:cysteine dioxygenase
MNVQLAEAMSFGLEELVAYCEQASSPLAVEELASLLRAVRLDPRAVAPYVRFDGEVYCRNSILRTDHVQLLVMCWSSGQLSPIHDHAGSACGIRVLNGRATEIVYAQTPCGLLTPQKSSHLEAGEISVSFDRDIHQMGNLEARGTDLVTLHCYSPPLSGMNLFEGSRSYFSDYDRTFEVVT